MTFKVGDKVVGNSYGFSHRIGETGTVDRVDETGTWVKWSVVDAMKTLPGGIYLVSRAAITEPTPPRKMHPDDFLSAVQDFAKDNDFKLNMITGRTKDGHHFSMAK